MIRERMIRESEPGAQEVMSGKPARLDCALSAAPGNCSRAQSGSSRCEIK
jgi:hypothetical protein